MKAFGQKKYIITVDVISSSPMNNTSDSRSEPSRVFMSDRIGISVIFLLAVIAVTLVAYCWLRSENTLRDTQQPPHRRRRPDEPYDDDDDDSGDLEAGLDKARLKSYPVIVYSQARKIQRLGPATRTDSCCSICLVDYQDPDVLRQVPECSHMFHLKCIDPWLSHHPNCPLCRSSPLQSPFAVASGH